MFTIIAIIITLVTLVVFIDITLCIIAILGGWAVIPIGAVVFALATLLSKLFGRGKET